MSLSLFTTCIKPEAVSSENMAAVRCSDGMFLSMEKSACSKCPFIVSSDDTLTCEYSAQTLDNLVKWTMQYGATGVAKSQFTRPCLFRDFSYVATDPWDKEFFEFLVSPERLKYYVPTINAAEKYKMDGLLDLLCVGLGCKLRGQDDTAKEILGVDKSTEFSEEELAKVFADYSWFEEAVKPKVPSRNA